MIFSLEREVVLVSDMAASFSTAESHLASSGNRIPQPFLPLDFIGPFLELSIAIGWDIRGDMQDRVY